MPTAPPASRSDRFGPDRLGLSLARPTAVSDEDELVLGELSRLRRPLRRPSPGRRRRRGRLPRCASGPGDRSTPLLPRLPRCGSCSSRSSGTPGAACAARRSSGRPRGFGCPIAWCARRWFLRACDVFFFGTAMLNTSCCVFGSRCSRRRARRGPATRDRSRLPLPRAPRAPSRRNTCIGTSLGRARRV